MCWAPYTNKKHTPIISVINSRYHKLTHKCGVQISKTVENAYRIDNENGDTYWADAILMEMKTFRVAFNILHGDDNIPPAHPFMLCHMVFGIKINTFKSKAQYVAGVHMTEPPSSITYTIVVPSESVHIALTMSARNDLYVLQGMYTIHISKHL